MIFKIEGQPQGKGRPRFTRSGHAFTPQATRNYEFLIASEYKDAGGEMFDGYVKINIKAYYKIPKATTKEKRGLIEKGLIKPAVKPDIDNVIKTILDGLNGIAYHDDNQVVYCSAEKYYAEEPCVIVEVGNYD
jgi:Holliday junction resolvase RusA-like endonuclease